MLSKILRDGLRRIVLAAVVLGSVATATAQESTLLLYGDSLMAGFGLPVEDGFAARLQAALVEAGEDITVLNASVSGDTSAAGLERLDWSLAERPDAVVLALGANDMLRGLSVVEMRDNLAAILTRLKAENIPVLLVGMRASRGLGDDYVAAYDASFADLADEFGVPLYPFLLEGVALDPSLNQADGIHPNAEGVKIMVDAILPVIIAAVTSP